MKAKLLKKLRRKGRDQITIYSVTKSGGMVVGMEIGLNDSKYRGLFTFGDTEESVLRKAEKIYIKNYLTKRTEK